MNQQFEYPLKQVLEVKQRRVDEAEKAVKEKQRLLEIEQKKLAEREAERDKVKNHKKEKLQQLRYTLDHESSSSEIQQMKVYLKIVEEKLKVEEKKVQDQKEQVKVAERNLEEAKINLHRKRQEVDKLLMHKKDWELEKRKEMLVIEAREQDELGSVIHSNRNRKR